MNRIIHSREIKTGFIKIRRLFATLIFNFDRVFFSPCENVAVKIPIPTKSQPPLTRVDQRQPILAHSRTLTLSTPKSSLINSRR